MKKKVVFINRYYRPDHSATSQLLTDLTLSLHIQDVDIHIITSRLYYSKNSTILPAYELLDNIHIHRVWTTTFGRDKLLGRSLDYLSFYVTSFIKMLMLANKNDLLIAKTDPPLISVLAAVAAKIKRAKLINWLQDVFPEIAKALGVKIINYGPIYPFLKFIRNWSLKTAHKNVVLDESMKVKIAAELGASHSIEIVHNWVVGDIKPIPKQENFLIKDWGLGKKFVVGYSGNLGRAHDYKSMLAAIKFLKDDKEIVFLFIGGGVGYNYIQEYVSSNGLNNVIFKPYQDINVLSYSLSAPDLHLISLEEELEGMIVPSKFYGILAAARPMLMIGGLSGALGKLIKSENIGEVVSPNNKDKLIEKIQESKASQDKINIYTSNAAKLHRNQFSKFIAIKKWAHLISQALQN